jgi:hypothetical protein
MKRTEINMLNLINTDKKNRTNRVTRTHRTHRVNRIHRVNREERVNKTDSLGRTLLSLGITLMVFVVSWGFSPVAQGRAYHYVQKPASDPMAQGASTSQTQQEIEKTQKEKDTKNMKSLANQASRNQNQGEMIGKIATGIAVGSALFFAGKCSSSDAAACELAKKWGIGAGVSAVVTLFMAQSKKSSMNSETYLSSDGNLGGNTVKTPEQIKKEVEESFRKDPQIQESQRKLNDAMKGKGIAVNLEKGTVTMPNGASFNPATATPEQLQAAGLTQADMNQVKDMVRESFEKAESQLAAVGLDKMDGNVIEGANSSPYAGPMFDLAQEQMGSSLLNNKDAKINRDPSQVAGLATKYNGDPVAVASENLFSLVNRRYDLKAKTDHFILKSQ